MPFLKKAIEFFDDKLDTKIPDGIGVKELITKAREEIDDALKIRKRTATRQTQETIKRRGMKASLTGKHPVETTKKYIEKLEQKAKKLPSKKFKLEDTLKKMAKEING